MTRSPLTAAMHEISLVQSVIEAITAEMPKHNITRVESIRLRIGEMTHIVPDALLFGFQVMSQGTAVEGAELVIESVPTKGRCRSCGGEFSVESWFGKCPECKELDIEIISGRELDIVEFKGS